MARSRIPDPANLEIKHESIIIHRFPAFEMEFFETLLEVHDGDIPESFDSRFCDLAVERHSEHIEPYIGLSDEAREDVTNKFGASDPAILKQHLMQAWLAELARVNTDLANLPPRELQELHREIKRNTLVERAEGKRSMMSTRNPFSNQAFSAFIKKDSRTDFPVYSKKFSDGVWHNFDFEVALEVLLSTETSFRMHKLIVLDALGTWIIAPHQQNEVQRSILRRVQSYLAKKEKQVLRHSSKDIFHGDLGLRLFTVGRQFIEQIYYPIGGIAALSVDIPKKDWEADLRKNYDRTLSSLLKVIHILHHESEANRDMSKYQRASLKRCFDCIREFNLSPQNNNITETAPRRKYVEQKSLENAIRDYQYVPVLAYAATLVKIKDDISLLDRFYGRKVKLTKRELRLVLSEWLEISTFLWRKVVDPLGSLKMSAPTHLLKLNLEPKIVRSPDLEPWEVEIVDRLMSKKHKSQKVNK